MIRVFYSLIAITLLIVSTSSLSANLYKWKDEKGQIYYGQTKPTNYKFELVNAPPPPPMNSPDLNKPFVEQMRKDSKKSASTKESFPDAPGQDANAKKQQCETARKNLQNLQQYARVKYTDSSGQTAVMPDDMKAEKIAESQKQIDFFCN